MWLSFLYSGFTFMVMIGLFNVIRHQMSSSTWWCWFLHRAADTRGKTSTVPGTTEEPEMDGDEETIPEVETKGLQQPQSEESNFEPQRHSWFTTRLRRLCGYAGVVVGEASNPGPAWCMYGERCPWHREKRCRFLHNGALDFWIVPQGDIVASLAQEVACLRLTLSAVQKELCATRQELADMRSTTAGTAVEPVTRPKSKKAGKRQRQKERKAAESGSFEEALEEHMGLLEESGPTGQTQSPALSLERIRSRPEGTWSPRPPSPRPEGTLSPRMQGAPKSPRGGSQPPNVSELMDAISQKQPSCQRG